MAKFDLCSCGLDFLSQRCCHLDIACGASCSTDDQGIALVGSLIAGAAYGLEVVVEGQDSLPVATVAAA